MTRFRCAALCAALAAFSVSAVAADAPLSQFSADTDVVVRIKAPKATIEKVASFVDKVQPGFGAQVRNFAPMIGALVQNPAMTEVSQTKDWYIAVFMNGQEEPSVMFAVPTTDADAAKAALGENFSSTVAGEWLYYSEDEEVLPDSPSADDTISAVMRGEPAATFDRGDIGVFVNVAGLTEQYADQLEAVKQQIPAVLEQVAQQQQASGMDAEQMLAVQKQMLEYVFQGVEDAEQLTVIVNFTDDAITVEDYFSFAKDSTSASALADQPTSDFKNAALMPSDAVAVFGASGNMEKIMEWGMKMSSMTPGQSEEARKAAADFVAGMKDVKFGSIVGSLSLGAPESGMIRSVSITEVNPAATYKELARKVAAEMGTVEANGIKQTTKIEADAETYGSTKADIVTVTMEADEGNPQAAMAQQMISMIFGPAGMQSRVAYLSDKVVTSFGGGKAAMEEALKKVSAGATSTQTSPHRKGLIASPNVLFLIDVPGLAMQGLKAASQIPGLPIPINAESLDNLKLEKSYIGFTAAADENAIRAKTRIPVTQVQSLVAVGLFIQQMQAGQGQ